MSMRLFQEKEVLSERLEAASAVVDQLVGFHFDIKVTTGCQEQY